MTPVVLATLLVLLASALGALGLVLLRKAAQTAPPRHRFSLGVLWSLIRHRPAWAAGLAAIAAGFAAQVAALDLGPVTLVQLVVVMELPFALVLSRLLLGGRLAASDQVAVGLMTVGTAGMILTLAPAPGEVTASAGAWTAGLVGIGLLIAGLLGVGHRRGGVARTVLHGTAAGVTAGLIAVLTKAVTPAIPRGLLAVVTTWQTWALLVTSVVGFLLLQNAMHAGRLVASQPGITLANPIVAGAWGVLVLHEPVRGGGWLVAAAVAAAVLVGGVLLLSRSPVLGGHTEAGGHEHDSGALSVPRGSTEGYSIE